MAPGYAIVTPAGELDIATAPQLRECLLAFLPARPALVVDLNQVSFCDATGLGVLAGAANRARASGTSLHLVCSRTDIRRLFELTGLTRRLPLARTLDEVGYDGVIDYDHPMTISGDGPVPKQYIAFAVG